VLQTKELREEVDPAVPRLVPGTVDSVRRSAQIYVMQNEKRLRRNEKIRRALKNLSELLAASSKAIEAICGFLEYAAIKTAGTVGLLYLVWHILCAHAH
jgi:hypothetical protein